MTQRLGLCVFTEEDICSIPGLGTKILQAAGHSQKQKKKLSQVIEILIWLSLLKYDNTGNTLNYLQSLLLQQKIVHSTQSICGNRAPNGEDPEIGPREESSTWNLAADKQGGCGSPLRPWEAPRLMQDMSYLGPRGFRENRDRGPETRCGSGKGKLMIYRCHWYTDDPNWRHYLGLIKKKKFVFFFCSETKKQTGIWITETEKERSQIPEGHKHEERVRVKRGRTKRTSLAV